MRLLPFASPDHQIVPGLAWYEQRFNEIQLKFHTEIEHLHKFYKAKIINIEEKLADAETQRMKSIEKLELDLREEFDRKLNDEIAHKESRIWETARETYLSDPGKTFLARDERILPTLDDVTKNTYAMWNPTTQYGKMASLSGNPGLPWAPKVELLEEVAKRGVDIKVILLHPNAIDLVTAMEARFTEGSIWISYSESELKKMFREKLIDELKQSVPLLSQIIGVNNIRFGKTPHFWKGCISDGFRCQYVFYDIPRKSVPFRYTENPSIVKWFEQYYFDPVWEDAMPIAHPSDVLKLL
jgi:hypothetical protein